MVFPPREYEASVAKITSFIGWPDQPARGLLPEVTVRGVGHMLGALCDAVPPHGIVFGAAGCAGVCVSQLDGSSRARHSGRERGRLPAPAAATILRQSRPGQSPRGARRYRRDCRMGAGRVLATRQPRLTGGWPARPAVLAGTGRCPVPGITAARTASRQRRGRGPRWSRWQARVWW